LKAKVTMKGFELNAEMPVTSELMAKGLCSQESIKRK
jgi:hypothetical protein